MCRLRFWCHLCWWMPWITWYTFVSWHSPYHFRSRFYHHPFLEARYSSLLCLFVVSSPPFHRRGGLSGTSLWHIVRPVLLRSSILSPLIYFNIPPQRLMSSTFFQTSPLGNLSHFKPYLVQWQLHTLIYIFTGSFGKNQKNRTSLHNHPVPSSIFNSWTPPSLLLIPIVSPHVSRASYPPRHRLPCIVSRLLSDCPRAGLLLPPLWAAPGIALQPLPGWASLWLLPTLSALSLLRQAKIHWAESEVGAVSRFTTFHHFCLREANAWGFTSHLTYPTVFRTKYSIKGQHYKLTFILHSPATCTLALA